MIRIIYGAKGCGKTTKVIDEANEMSEKTSGSIVFVTDTDRYKFDLKYNIRLINVKNYGVSSEEELAGFVKGILASNSDIDVMYVDGAHRITGKTVEEMEQFYTEVASAGTKCAVEIVLTASTATLPAFLKDFDAEQVK